MWEQEKGKGDESKMGAKVNYLELLKQWGDVLLRLQIRQMDDLKEQGKTKSATYRQLMGRKMTYQSMISMYEVYGLL